MWSIIKSHFHKGKTGFIITGLFIILSVLMMIIGLSICLGMDGLYSNARILSNSPDCWICVYEKRGGATQALLEDILNNRDDVDKYDIQDAYYFEPAKNEDDNNRLTFVNGDKHTTVFNGWCAMNIDDENNAFRPHLRNTVEKEGYKFYVSGNFVETSHISVGDEVIYVNRGKQYIGYVAGIYDDMTRIYWHDNVYIGGDLYDEITRLSLEDSNIVGEYNINILLNCANERENTLAQLELRDVLTEAVIEYTMSQIAQDPTAKAVYCSFAMREEFRTGTRGFILLLGTAMTAFSIIVAIIVAIVIAFLVRSNVLDEVRNLGVWKALGYTTTQLRLSYLAIYSVISGVCIIVGMLLGIGLMPTFVHIITDMARLDCSRAISVNAGAIVIAIALVVAVVASVVYLATARVKRITPLSAMRNNLETHSFKKNKAPLSSSKLSVNAHLGVKSVVGETHRSIMVVAIVLIMSLLCSFVSVVFYNLKVDQTAVINMSAVEKADFYIGFYYEDCTPYFDAISKMDGFEADVVFTRAGVDIDGEHGYGQLYGSFDHMRTDFLYKGRYPKYANEILIEEQYAKSKGLNIGDSVTLHMEADEKKSDKSCVIVGSFQNLLDNARFMGYFEIIDELYDLNEFWHNTQHLIYFESGKAPTVEQLDSVLREVAGGSVLYDGFETGQDRLDNYMLNTVGTAADAVMSVFFAITAIVIALLLVMLVKLKLLRERRNYAIYKALGYTTAGIMSQIAVAMLILGAIGSVIGAIIGAVTTSPLLTLFGGFIGAGHFAFAIPWGYTAGIVFSITVLIYCVSMLCALPVRKIAPAEHLREHN